MSLRKWALAVIVLLVLVTLFMGAMVQEDAVAAAGLRPDAAPYSVRGAHDIGTRRLLIDGEPPVAMSVWYPAGTPRSDDDAITYPYEIKVMSLLGSTTIAAFQGQASRNASYDLAAGPYPLIILSPGFAIGSKTYAWLAEHLASHGFVVMSPEHDEHLATAMSGLWRSAVTRPRVMRSVLAYVDEQVGSGGTLEGLIDTGTVAVVGHSYGGYAALVAGGARLETDGFAARCQSASEADDPNVWLCEALLPHIADMADLAGLDSVPEGLWPRWSDDRVDAVVSMAGDAYLFDRAGLAEVTVPVMAIGGTNDSDTPYLWGTHPTYEFVSSRKKVRITLEGAEHMIFTGQCQAIRRVMKIAPTGFCSDSDWDRGRAHDLIKHYTTAFLLTELKQASLPADVLAPNAVGFRGVAYDAQGY